MKRSVWLEVALNGTWTRKLQPNVPIQPDEIIKEGVDCANAGAAIVHYHAFDRNGQETSDPEINRYIIEGIRSQVDVIVYPTINIISQEDSISEEAGFKRYQHYDQLAKRGLIEWMALDPGSCNISRLDQDEVDEGFVYINTGASTTRGHELAAEHGIHPSYAIYEPGFIRTGAAFHKTIPNVPTPIYRLMFSNQFTFGYPPEELFLESYVELLKLASPESPWMVAGLGVHIEHLIPKTIELGGHIRVGLEDTAIGTKSTNVSLVENAVNTIEKNGGSLASASEIREWLGKTNNN